MAYKNTPIFSKKMMQSMGERVGSVRRMNKFDTRVYTFSYRSKGTDPYKPRPNKDKQPLFLVAYRDGQKLYSIRGKPTQYMYGFNLNMLSPARRLATLIAMRDTYRNWEGGPVDWQTLRDSLNLPAQNHNTIFRKYRVGGGNMTGLVAVDLDKYITELENKRYERRTGE